MMVSALNGQAFGPMQALQQSSSCLLTKVASCGSAFFLCGVGKDGNGRAVGALTEVPAASKLHVKAASNHCCQKPDRDTIP